MLAFEAIRRAFDFNGRSSRQEYWHFIGIFLFALLVTFSFDRVAWGANGTPALSLLLLVASIIPTYSLTMRRLHDRDRTGWWIIILWTLNMAAGFAMGFQNEVQYTSLSAVANVITYVVLAAQLATAFFLLVQMCLPGTSGENRFGMPPSTAEPVTRTASEVGDLGTRATSFVSKIGQGDPLTQIERLSKLRSDGMLTDEEFGAQKAVLLKRL